VLLLAAIGRRASGWRFLAGGGTLVRRHLNRAVQFGAGQGADRGFRLSLLGRVRLQLAALEVANPAWSELGPMVHARQVELNLRYRDLVAALRGGGQPLTLQSLRADGLALQLERGTDGRASWQFGRRSEAAADTEPAISGVHFELAGRRQARAA
jgi:uncharacterized protein involved in outer membrane biogenesis